MKKLRAWFYKYSYAIYIGILMLVLLGAVFYNSIFFSIMPGERAVIWHRFGGGTNLERVYHEGFIAIAPWDILYKYNVRVQAATDTVSAIVESGLELKIQYTLHFKPREDSLALLHQRLGPDYVRKIIIPQANSVARTVLSEIPPDSIYNNVRQNTQDKMLARMRAAAETRYVEFYEVLVRNISLPDSVQIAIEQKLAEEQRFLTYEYRLLREEQEAERKLIEARGLRAFEDTSGVSPVIWRGLSATEKIATSDNAKVIVIGTDSGDLPIILGGNN